MKCCNTNVGRMALGCKRQCQPWIKSLSQASHAQIYDGTSNGRGPYTIHTSATSPQTQDAGSLDVSGAVVSPSFRSSPWEDKEAAAEEGRNTMRVLFVSESGVCRAVLAAACFSSILQQHGFSDRVECVSRVCGWAAAHWS
jgi:hypothetical protein